MVSTECPHCPDPVFRCEEGACSHYLDALSRDGRKWLCACCKEAETQAAARRLQVGLL